MEEILFLTHRVPWPPNRGDKIRSHHILRKLLELAPVHLTCFADDEEEAALDCDIKPHLASCYVARREKAQWMAGVEALATGKPVSLTSFGSRELQNHVSGLVNHGNIACIVIFSGQMAQYIPDDYTGRVVMDFADVDSAKFESYGKEGQGPMAWINAREGKLLRAFEKQIAERAEHSLFVSAAEVDLFQQRSGLDDDKVVAMGNGIDLAFYDPKKVTALERETVHPLIVFTGQMDYRPNIQAVSSFAAQAMPIILQNHPTAEFAIVGRAPTAEVQQLDGVNNTKVIGEVDDIRSWLDAADVIVAPLRIARGIQNKVLEAMAMGKAVVASTAAAEGIDAIDGQHYLVGTDVTHEAELVNMLIKEPSTAKKIGKAAAELIRTKYSWQGQLAALPILCDLHNVTIAEAAE